MLPSASDPPARPVPTSAVGKIVAVAEALDRPRQLGQIARDTGLPLPTVHRILTDLTAHGWVVRTSYGGYAPGPRLGQLGARVDTRVLASSRRKP